ncbi:alpha/beta hydrolase [Natrinema longum]|uniref:Alpha/beta fold hydrolase n=1 Tax=Natrinema longum TaxID=370324 RepID=A0A8A2U5X9_9EURY|nr:alpha/beta fold hydrolase [Natrinema longum]MBZ6494641.1 alpha/beta fold hydrolase [Natrinema longum]QSW84043.1 alpha/beta fold hydrolase [Natrinema longum]
MPSRRKQVGLLVLSLLLVFSGSALAHWGQTAGGEIDVRQVEIETDGGGTIDGYLYVPDGVSSDDPAPGVLAIHGYINSKETQSSFAIEYARRGHVVLAIDQPGHGYSDPPAFANGWGGPPALEYLADHELVDENNVGLEGHSMGGWAAVSAAAEHPNSYESIVLVGSSTGSAGAPEGNETFPRNLGVVFADYDEFHWLMWGSATGPATPESEKLQSVFGTEDGIDEGEVYGSIDDGTARALYTPQTTHPGAHHTPSAVSDTVGWTQQTLEGADEEPGDHVWYWKEIGTAIALLGGFLFLVPAGSVLTGREPFADATRTVPDAVTERDRGWYVAALLAAVIPVVLYYPTMLIGSGSVPVTPVTPQGETNGIVLWALANVVVIAGLFGLWHRDAGRSLFDERYGLDIGDGARTIATSLAVAVGAVGGLYVLLWIVDTLFMTDFRAWVLGLKLMSAVHARIFVTYLPAFLAFFVALGVLLHGRLRTPETTRSLPRAMATNAVILTGGFALLLVIQYGTLFATGALAIPITALQTIIAFQFLALLPVIAVVSTYFFHRTGRIWTGAFVNALLITWLIVASQATHYAF